MFHSPARSKRLVALLLLLIAALAAGFALRSPTVVSARQPDPVTAAWEKARASGSYHFDTDVVQITLPSSKITNVGRSSRVDELRMEGKTNLQERSLELQLWSTGGSVAQQAVPPPSKWKMAKPIYARVSMSGSKAMTFRSKA